MHGLGKEQLKTPLGFDLRIGLKAELLALTPLGEGDGSKAAALPKPN